jgi:hypothetical protein
MGVRSPTDLNYLISSYLVSPAANLILVQFLYVMFVIVPGEHTNSMFNRRAYSSGAIYTSRPCEREPVSRHFGICSFAFGTL